MDVRFFQQSSSPNHCDKEKIKGVELKALAAVVGDDGVVNQSAEEIDAVKGWRVLQVGKTMFHNTGALRRPFLKDGGTGCDLLMRAGLKSRSPLTRRRLRNFGYHPLCSYHTW